MYQTILGIISIYYGAILYRTVWMLMWQWVLVVENT